MAGATAGLTAGVYDNLLGTKTNPVTGQVVVDLSTVEGVGRFAANQALQGSTSTALYRALGEDSDFSQVLGNALVNTFAAYGFNLVGDLGDRYQLPSGSAEKVVLHALMGGLAAEAYGGDFASGALVAGVNELVVAGLNAQFAGLPDEQREALLVMNAQLLGVLTAALQNPDGDVEQLEIGSSIARNAVQYNHELHEARAASFAEGAIDLCKQRPDICPAGSQSVTQEELVEALQVIAAHGEGMEVVDPQAMALASHVLTLFGSTSETLFTPTESEQARIDSIETAEWILAVGSAVGTTAAVARNVLTAGPGKLTSWFSGLMGRSGDDVVGGANRLPVPSDLPFNIHAGQQGKHIRGHNNFEEGRSYFNDGIDPAELLSGVHSGKYPVVGAGARGNPIVDFGRPIGVDGRTGLSVTRGQIHYGKNGAHIVPDMRN
ncbi:polymorphic toxin type 50 domain-containing protein [Pseudomonas sp.]|uniref:polymorphic toxin type 50 domain-containing protein n=1 Tax=Pseudomonas sp. TaxID=306 RepID=UPI003CC5D322